jgi:hypothetical protein
MFGSKKGIRCAIVIGVISVIIAVSGSNASFAKAQEYPGSISGNVYTNESFGITYVFPQGWFVDKKITDEMNSNANKFRESQSEGDQSVFKPSYTLLRVSDGPQQAPCQNCPPRPKDSSTITLSVAPMAASGADQTAYDMQNGFKRRFDGRGAYRVIRGPMAFSVNGQLFSRMDASNGNTFQGDAITIRKHFRIEFQISATTTERLEDLYKTLSSLQLKP